MEENPFFGELMAGNERFRRSVDRELLATLSKGQKPEAIVAYCSDSRVPVETIFDQPPGKLFGIRLAGNPVESPHALASIEYAVEHLKTPIIIVLGHSSCGAITAAMKGGEEKRKHRRAAR